MPTGPRIIKHMHRKCNIFWAGESRAESDGKRPKRPPSPATRRSSALFASALEIISALLRLATRMTSCSSTMALAFSSELLRRASASFLALPINSSRAATRRLASAREEGMAALISLMISRAFSLSMMHLSLPSGTPQASAIMLYSPSSSSITSVCSIQFFLHVLAFSSISGISSFGTRPVRSAWYFAISRTTDEERKVYFSLAVRNMVSRSGLIFLLIRFI